MVKRLFKGAWELRYGILLIIVFVPVLVYIVTHFKVALLFTLLLLTPFLLILALAKPFIWVCKKINQTAVWREIWKVRWEITATIVIVLAAFFIVTYFKALVILVCVYALLCLFFIIIAGVKGIVDKARKKLELRALKKRLDECGERVFKAFMEKEESLK